MTAETDKSGCLQTLAIMVGVYALLTAISVFAGRSASLWFGLGALFSCAVAFWEAGRKKLSADHDTAAGDA